MSEKNWTPGPWVVRRHDSFCDTEWRIKPAPPIKGSTIGFAPHAIVKGDLRIVTDAEKKANAHLIAAAPELYEALDDLTDDYEVQSALGWSKLAVIQALLAKARGEA